MKALNRRILTAVTVALLLVASLMALTWVHRDQPVTAQPAQSEAVRLDALTRFRTEREQRRQRQRAELNDIIHDAKTDAETLSLAQRQLMALIDAEDAEGRLEGLIGARGFDNALVSVSDGAVNVLVRREKLTRQETAVILDLVLRETGVSGGSVRIIPIN